MFYSNQNVKEKSLTFQYELRTWHDQYLSSKNSKEVRERADTLLGALLQSTIVDHFDEFMRKGVPFEELATALSSSSIISYKNQITCMLARYWIKDELQISRYSSTILTTLWDGILSHHYATNNKLLLPIVCSLTENHFTILERFPLPPSVYTKFIFLLNKGFDSDFQKKMDPNINRIFQILEKQSDEWWRKRALTHINIIYNALDVENVKNSSNSVPKTYETKILHLNKAAYETACLAKNLGIPWVTCAKLFEDNVLVAPNLHTLELDAHIFDDLNT